ncbi:MAG: extracellular solute-binding protein, partial [Chloroflexi bacterium]|nr:extracellular solute-binding protein [Chloroflexota bacterium]
LLSACAPAAPTPTTAPAKPAAAAKPTEAATPAAPAAAAAPAASPAAAAPAASPATAAPAASPAAAAPAASPAAKPAASAADEQARVAKLVEGAKQEGTLVWMGSALEEPSMVKEMEALFKKTYGLPDSFKLSATRKSVREIPTLVENEIKAGKVTNDIINISNLAWWESMVKNNQVMSYDSPNYAAYSVPEKLGYNHRPYFVSDGYTFIIGWNKKSLPNLTVNSYGDLLKPELKGKLSFSTSWNSSTGLPAFIAMKKTMGDDFWKKLAAQDPVMLDSSAQRMDAVVSGEYPITGLAIPGDLWVQINEKKVDYIGYAWPQEGSVLLPISTAILAKAPHPNAAMLFIDFFRTKEAQEIWMRGEGYLSGRDGVTSPDPKLLKPMSEIKAVPFDFRGFEGAAFKAPSDEWRATFEK